MLIPSLSDWTAVGTRNQNKDFDINLWPLQVKTDSKTGSGDVMWVRFVELNSHNGAGIWVTFDDPPTYDIGYFGQQNIKFTMPSTNKNRIWTFSKRDNAVKLFCNGVEIFDYSFTESTLPNCKIQWNLNLAQIQFAENTNIVDRVDIRPAEAGGHILRVEIREHAGQGRDPEEDQGVRHAMPRQPVKPRPRDDAGRRGGASRRSEGRRCARSEGVDA